MPKKSLSSLEIAALVQELQFVVGGKISQVYQDEKEVILQLHVPSKGKQLLKIISGKFICLTSKKEASSQPSSFCMQMRKYLDNVRIEKLYQKDSERIVVLELEGKDEEYYLILELFSKGNVILARKDWQIIGVLEQQVWKDRLVKPGEKYIFPAAALNWKKLTERELAAILHKSEKKNVASSLATEVGLGGVYAEELCKRASLDKEKFPSEINVEEVKLVVSELRKMLMEAEKPRGYVYVEEVTPFALVGQVSLRVTERYSEAIDELNPLVKKSPYERRIITLQKTILDQQESLKSQEEKIVVNKKKGELIYEKYMPLQKLLGIVKELRKDKDWNEIALELKKEKKIKQVNLKDKKVVIEL